jgi:hypothetical protein
MAEDDVDTFIKEGAEFHPDARAKYDAFRGRRGSEQKMWERWDQGGRKPEQLGQLLESIDPLVTREAQRRAQGLGGRIPVTTLKNELRNHAVTALHNYDPQRKTQLSTHIHQNFMRVTDFIAQNRNTRRMPRAKVERYQEFENAKQSFQNEVGRAPTTLELQQLLPGWSKKLLGEMERGFGAEAFANMGVSFDGDSAQEDSVRGAYLMSRPLLTDQERTFGDRYFTPEGTPRVEVRALARNMNIGEHKAYRIKAKIETRMAPILKNR